MSNEPALTIQDLRYEYRSHWTYRVKGQIKPFSLEIAAGESFGFLGHNGAGKTTTIKCILGLIRPKAGLVKIFGTPHSDPLSRKMVGYIPEQPYFYDNIRVRETMMLYATLTGLRGFQRASLVDESLERVGLSDRARSPVRSLSKGLMQRLALAQAIVHKPKLLILDEPFSGLDPIGRREFRDIFEAMKKQGTALFLSSHILSDVEALCSRVSIMVKGELKGIYNLRELSSSGGSFHILLKHEGELPLKLREQATQIQILNGATELIVDSRVAAESIVRSALDSGAELISYEMDRPSLEKLFLSVVTGQNQEVPHGQ